MESWNDLAKRLRAGSRIVLYRPDVPNLPLEFGRRGFRVFLVHESADFLARSKQHFRDTGLASQLMGAHRLEENPMPKLARGFYDIFLFCASSTVCPTQVEFAVEPGGMLIAPTRAVRWPDTPANQVERLPEGFRGYYVT